MHPNIIPNYSRQDATFLDLFISTDALHVSGGSSSHHQEHVTVHTASVLSNYTAANCYREWYGTSFHLIHDSTTYFHQAHIISFRYYEINFDCFSFLIFFSRPPFLSSILLQFISFFRLFSLRSVTFWRLLYGRPRKTFYASHLCCEKTENITLKVSS